MRHQNKQRYPPIATAKPLPTRSQRGTAATATEIAKDTACDENDPPPGHPERHERLKTASPAWRTATKRTSQDLDACCGVFQPSGRPRRRWVSRGTRPEPPWLPPWTGDPPVEHTTGSPADPSALAGSVAHRTSNRSIRTFRTSGEEVPERHILGGDRHHAGNPTRSR